MWFTGRRARMLPLVSVMATLTLVACSPPDGDGTQTGGTPSATVATSERSELTTAGTVAGADSAVALGRCPVLKPGTSGACVELLQDLLVSASSADAAAFTRGTFDDAVTKAVADFQARVGLDADGEVGDLTKQALLSVGHAGGLSAFEAAAAEVAPDALGSTAVDASAVDGDGQAAPSAGAQPASGLSCPSGACLLVLQGSYVSTLAQLAKAHPHLAKGAAWLAVQAACLYAKGGTATFVCKQAGNAVVKAVLKALLGVGDGDCLSVSLSLGGGGATVTGAQPYTGAGCSDDARTVGDLRAAAAADRDRVEELVDHWVPQLASGRLGLQPKGGVLTAEGVLSWADQLEAYDALLFNSHDYTHRLADVHWVYVAPQAFDDPQQVFDWCDAQGRGPHDCFARFVTHHAKSPMQYYRRP